MFLSCRTDRSGHTVQTQISLLLEEQFDQGLHCLQFPLHLLDALLYKETPSCSTFRVITTNILGVQNVRIFTIIGLLSTLLTLISRDGS